MKDVCVHIHSVCLNFSEKTLKLLEELMHLGIILNCVRVAWDRYVRLVL